MIPGLDPDKCARRNRLAARRDGVTAVPMHFLSSQTLAGSANGDKNTIEPLCSIGAALAKINALCPGDEPVTEDDVYIHWLEAANSNFIGDRFMFLGTSTLKNIVRDGNGGIAFMNSHRTGGLSHPSELPFGRSFIASYEKGDPDVPGSARALLGIFMLRGQKPNGENGPTTDALSAGINAGTIFDVSVGLYGGTDICDVCGNDVDAYDPDEGWLCDHLPGTTWQMTDEEVQAQKDRGVPGGEATSTLQDSGCGEVSAVFDGAVPGAGFRKALSLARAGGLDKTAAAQARTAYAPLLSKGDLNIMDGQNAILATIQEGFERLGIQLGKKEQTPPGPSPAPAATAELSAEAKAKLQEQEQTLAAQKETLAVQQTQIEQLRKEAVDTKVASQLQADESWIENQVKAFKITPAAADHFKKLAKEHPEAFAAMKPGIEANGAVVGLGAGQPAEDLANNSQGSTEGKQLEDLAKKYQTEHKCSYSDAFSIVCSENKDLAAAYRDAQSEGVN